MKPEVIGTNLLAVKVCVPDEWTDEQIKSFTDIEHPCGTENGWFVRKEGDPGLQGTPDRIPCAERKGFVHVTLGA